MEISQAGALPLAGDDPDGREMIAEALTALAKDPDELERELAVLTLSEYSTEQARMGIVSALNDRSALVREQAVARITEWPDQDERQQMILAALDKQRVDVIVPILESITEVNDRALIKRLTVLSRHSNPEVRKAAQLSLNLADN